MSEAKKDDSDLNALLCGCGRGVRYSHMQDGEMVMSCNKRVVCPTYDQLRERMQKAETRQLQYQKAINQIDDYFEYANESKQDQKKVHQILGNLTDALKAT